MQIGKETGRRGMKDLDEIIPLLHLSRRPTFFTHDLGFFDHSLCHNGYALICLDVGAKETAAYIRRCLRHPEFQAEKQRLEKVILARQRNLSFWEIGTPRLQIKLATTIDKPLTHVVSRSNRPVGRAN